MPYIVHHSFNWHSFTWSNTHALTVYTLFLCWCLKFALKMPNETLPSIHVCPHLHPNTHARTHRHISAACCRMFRKSEIHLAREYLNSTQKNCKKRPCYLPIIYSLLIHETARDEAGKHHPPFSWTEILLAAANSYLCQSENLNCGNSTVFGCFGIATRLLQCTRMYCVGRQNDSHLLKYKLAMLLLLLINRISSLRTKQLDSWNSTKCGL